MDKSGFNSRTRVGATAGLPADKADDIVSIHAPVWVRQIVLHREDPRKGVSIHAPVWVRLDVNELTLGQKRFNSRTRVGATA